jgi:hypothetical protein
MLDDGVKVLPEERGSSVAWFSWRCGSDGVAEE